MPFLDITGDVLSSTLDEDVGKPAAPPHSLWVAGVDTEETFQSYCAAEQKKLQPAKLTPLQVRARVNQPLPDLAEWSATRERVAEDEATIFGYSASQLEDSKMQEAMGHMRVARRDEASRIMDRRNLSDKDLKKIPGHAASLEETVCEATDSCPTITLESYQRLTPDRPRKGSYVDTVVFEAAAHNLAFGPNVPVGHRIFFLDDGTVQLLTDKTTTNGRLLRGLQVSHSHSHPRPRRFFTPTSTLSPEPHPCHPEG